MKKILVTLALVMALTVCGCAATQDGGGLFHRGNPSSDKTTVVFDKGGFPGLPGHGETGDQPAPIGSGAIALTLLGGAYLIGKKSKENE